MVRFEEVSKAIGLLRGITNMGGSKALEKAWLVERVGGRG